METNLTSFQLGYLGEILGINLYTIIGDEVRRGEGDKRRARIM